MDDYIINLVVLGVISWGATFFLTRRIFPNLSFDFSNNVVSSIHASLAVVLSSLSVQDWKCPVCPLASKSSTAQMQTLAVSFAYMVYDQSCCLFGKQFKLDNSIHHLVCILGFGAALAYEKISFAVLFTFARMVCGPYLTYVTVSANNPLLIKAMAVGLQLVSFFWFYKITRLVKYKLTRRAATSKDLAEVRPYPRSKHRLGVAV
ncbi:uncharacterized protein LOC130786199 isoform X3 [Actinidia eriantha]|uniref:uncharacterized protein LOC130786199 isoform X3 n=1 Tax=Actinidia eriantha TaxID=165200 RepID=UPI00258FDD16|nr:uncharacterized protein LOC130786199 isoform X3 [Actinidia eriantha]